MCKSACRNVETRLDLGQTIFQAVRLRRMLILREGLGYYEQGRLADAVWSWRFLFFTHWGRHASSALRAIIWRLGTT